MANGMGRSAQPLMETANDRFKRRFGDMFLGSLITATVLHFMVFAFWPRMGTADVRFVGDDIVVIDIPVDIELPPEPEQIVRPATPVVSDIVLDDDITIPRVTYDILREPLAPPRAAGGDDIGRGPVFTPYTVYPELRHRAAVQRALERSYPPLLRDAGIGGTPTVWFLIDENGRVVRTQLNQSSGSDALDRAAMGVARIMEFRPAMNHDRRVPVWVSIPIVFAVR